MTSFTFLRFWLLSLLAFSGMSLLARAAALVPATPTNCTAEAASATATYATVNINWNDNSTTETHWKIQYSSNSGTSYTDYPLVSSSTGVSTGSIGVQITTTFLLNTTYLIRIVAMNGTTPSVSASNVTSVGTFNLNAPGTLVVTAIDPFNVTMSWTDNSTGDVGFAIERKLGTGAWQYLGTVVSSVLSLTPNPLITPLGVYSFRIRAFKGGAPTTPDSAVGSTAVSPYSTPATVTAGSYTLTASAVPGQTVVNLSWPNILNEAGYQISYKIAGGGYAVLGYTNVDVTTYQITTPTIEAANNYSFIIRPHDGSYTLGNSSEASATVDGLTSKTGTSGTPGSAFSHTFTQVTGTTVSSRTLTGVPAGLAFNANTGVLSGVYPAVGTYTLNYTANFTGGSLTQTFFIRVRPPAGAPAVGTLIPAWSGAAGGSRASALAGTFTDLEAESAVRVSTTLGNMDFILFNAATPATVTNFMNYVTAGKYSDVAFHRSIAGFVIQGGGFKGAGTASNFTSVITNPPVINEPGIANERGTVSMAKLGGNPNSATSQFFVSLGDNRANLDYQNSGFTVFGRVAGNGMAVADAISNLPNDTYNLFLDGSATATAFSSFPINAPTLPTTMDQTKVVKMNSVATIPTLTFSITGNTNPSVGSASIVSGQLHLVGLAGGQTTVTVTATDLDNLTTTQSVVMNISDTYATWASRNLFSGGQSGIAQNPDGDAWSNLQEFAFMGAPAVSNPTGQVVFPGTTGVAPAASYLTLTFPVRKFTQGLSYTVEANDGLSGTWTEIWKSADGFAHLQIMTALNLADRTVVTVKDTVAIGTRPKRFLRTLIVNQ